MKGKVCIADSAQTGYCTTFPCVSVRHRRDTSSFLNNLTLQTICIDKLDHHNHSDHPGNPDHLDHLDHLDQLDSLDHLDSLHYAAIPM